MANKINFENPIYCIITGASRGIGRTIAIELASRAKNQIILVLMARSEKNLNETKESILETNKNANVNVIVTDLSKPDPKEYENVLKSTLTFKESFTAIIFHNAGHIGCIDKQINLSDVKIWQDYYTLNVFSAIALNSVFIKFVKELTQNVFVINITSLIGRQPFQYFSMYGTAKSARDLYFKVLAVEESYCKILNYSPGLVSTDMSSEVVKELEKIEKSKNEAFQNALTTDQTVNKMFKVLGEGKFESGDIIDYWDVE